MQKFFASVILKSCKISVICTNEPCFFCMKVILLYAKLLINQLNVKYITSIIAEIP